MWLLRRGGGLVIASLDVVVGMVPMGTLVWLVIPTVVAAVVVVGALQRVGFAASSFPSWNHTRSQLGKATVALPW